MALELIGAASTTTAFTTTPIDAGQWVQWSESTVAWATAEGNSLILFPGRYRVESPSGVTLYLIDPWENQGALSADVLVEHKTRKIQIFISNDKAGTVFITRLA